MCQRYINLTGKWFVTNEIVCLRNHIMIPLIGIVCTQWSMGLRSEQGLITISHYSVCTQFSKPEIPRKIVHILHLLSISVYYLIYGADKIWVSALNYL